MRPLQIEDGSPALLEFDNLIILNKSRCRPNQQSYKDNNSRTQDILPEEKIVSVPARKTYVARKDKWE